MHIKSRAKKLNIAEAELKLPVTVSMAFSTTRERDWANVVTAHDGRPHASTWLLPKYRCASYVQTAAVTEGPPKRAKAASRARRC